MRRSYVRFSLGFMFAMVTLIGIFLGWMFDRRGDARMPLRINFILAIQGGDQTALRSCRCGPARISFNHDGRAARRGWPKTHIAPNAQIWFMG
jgi:uncharacterized membrane protein YfcA